jgi:hypothetical protein
MALDFIAFACDIVPYAQWEEMTIRWIVPALLVVNTEQ